MWFRQLAYRAKKMNSRTVMCSHFKDDILLTLYTIYTAHAKWKTEFIWLQIFTRIPTKTELFVVPQDRAKRDSILERHRYHRLTTLLLIIGRSSQLEKKKKKRQEKIHLSPEKFQMSAVTATFLNSVDSSTNIMEAFFPITSLPSMGHQWIQGKGNCFFPHIPGHRKIFLSSFPFERYF